MQACYAYLKNQLRIPGATGCVAPLCMREHVKVGASVNAGKRARLKEAFESMAAGAAKDVILEAIARIPAR